VITRQDLIAWMNRVEPPEFTVLVEPHRVAEVQAAVEAQLRASDLPFARVTVKGSLAVPEGQAIVINETEVRRALDDSVRRSLGLPTEGGEQQ
jgi:hypothetical protein